MILNLPEGSCVWAGSHVPASVADLGLRAIHSPEELGDAPGLLVIGGGARIDEAKALRLKRPELKLVALPTLWGSGAEASPVVVLNRPGAKEIHVDEGLIPDGVVLDEEVLSTISETQIRHACADTWAHALEGCFSPLASEELQQELTQLIQEILAQPVEADMNWFDLSARACAGQARSGVGLAHGLAHALEPLLNDPIWGHARLICAVLPSVLRFNMSQGDKWACTAKALGLDLAAILQAVDDLADVADWEYLVPHMEAHWKTIARDPCSRVNSVLVRGSSLVTLLES